MPLISLGFEYQNGGQVSPDNLHRLVEEATINQFTQEDFSLGSIRFWSYGSSRPTLSRGAVHYDSTAGAEGLFYAWQSASNASISQWLCALPRRECLCWTNSALSAGSPVFIGLAGVTDREYNVYDGCAFPIVNQFTGASGVDAAFFITLESAPASSIVKCMWAGIVPQTLNLVTSASNASAGRPLFVDYAEGGAFKFGDPSSRQFIFGVNTLNGESGRGAIIWGAGPAIEDIA